MRLSVSAARDSASSAARAREAETRHRAMPSVTRRRAASIAAAASACPSVTTVWPSTRTGVASSMDSSDMPEA